MKHTKSLICAAAICLSATTAHATASADQAAEWTHLDMPNGQIIYSGDAGSTGLIFTCTNEGKLDSMLNLDGGDILEKIASKSTVVRNKKGTLSIDGREEIREDWLYHPSTKMAEPRKFSISHKLYNAAVTGSPIELKMSYVDAVNVTPPPVNDAFKSFASTCGATNGS